MDLAKPIELNGECMVGLCKFIYPRTWYNPHRDLSYVQLNWVIDEPQPLLILKFGRGGYYNRAKELLDQLIRRSENTIPLSTLLSAT